MCKCCCEEEKTPIEQCMGHYNNALKVSEEERNIRMQYVNRNIPTILNLVNQYNKLLGEHPETAKDAEEMQNLMNSLAIQIVNYTR